MKKVAVITDAVSAEYFFPVWVRYYGGLFGNGNLFVVTYGGQGPAFAAFRLGRVWDIPGAYSDGERARLISELVGTLLESYDVVVRCDVDEFLVPERPRHADLRAYIESTQSAYVTAYGIDLIEATGEEKLDLERPILVAQRRWGVRASPLNKTCITSAPLRWAEGFHGTTRSPAFGDLFLFHAKFTDVTSRIEWFALMQSQVAPGSSEFEYFAEGAARLRGHQAWCLQKDKKAGELMLRFLPFDDAFLRSVAFNAGNAIYQGAFMTDDHIFDVPDIYTGAF